MPDTRLDNFLHWWKNHRLASAILLVGIVVVAIGKFADSLMTLTSMMPRSEEPIEIVDIRVQDSKIDLLIRNPGESPAVIHTAELEILTLLDQHWTAPPGIGGFVLSTRTYHAMLTPTDTRVEIGIAQAISPKDVDRFGLIIRAGIEVQTPDFVDVESIYRSDGTHLADMTISGRLRLRFNKNNSVTSDPFELTIIGASPGSSGLNVGPTNSFEQAIRQLESDDYFSVHQALEFLRAFEPSLDFHDRVITSLFTFQQRDIENLNKSYESAALSWSDDESVSLVTPDGLRTYAERIAIRLQYSEILNLPWSTSIVFEVPEDSRIAGVGVENRRSDEATLFVQVISNEAKQYYKIKAGEAPELIGAKEYGIGEFGSSLDYSGYQTHWTISPSGSYAVSGNTGYSMSVENSLSGLRIFDTTALSGQGQEYWAVDTIDWSFDETRLYFDNSGTNACIWELNLDSHSLRKIVPEHDAHAPVYYEERGESRVAYILGQTVRIATPTKH